MSKKLRFEKDYDAIYKNSDEWEKGVTRFDFGMIELDKLVKMVKRGLISKSDYNNYRKTLEKQLLGI